MKKYTSIMSFVSLLFIGCINPLIICKDENDLKLKYSQTEKKINSIKNEREHNLTITSIEGDVGLVNHYQLGNIKVHYSGDSNLGLANGNGKAVWVFENDTLEIYEGGFEMGYYQGKGIQNLLKGEISEGVWDLGKLRSDYITKYSTGTVVKGKWNQSTNNYAEINYGNGDTYLGFVSDDCPDSLGFYKWKTGESFDGLFKMGKMKEGRYSYSNGKTVNIKKQDNIDSLTKQKDLKSIFEKEGVFVMPIVDMKELTKAVIYPCSAKISGFEGRVITRCTIDINGDIIKTVFLSPRYIPEEIKMSVLNALYSIKFSPGKVNGKPVKVLIAAPIQFKLRN